MKARIWDPEDHSHQTSTKRTNDHLRRAAEVNKNARLIQLKDLHDSFCQCSTCWTQMQLVLMGNQKPKKPKKKAKPKAKAKPKLDLSTKRRKIKI